MHFFNNLISLMTPLFSISILLANAGPIPEIIVGADGQPIAVCPKMCPPVSNPICASNNGILRTFENDCLMHLRNCRSDDTYELVHQGRC
ncbi:MAG: hypothetical protein J3R72DRAFT_429234 [Linnemannia gamsii]|nr:MAG: hypothetical protein J3R72DRAFT_429234 [Linnemannia gamsii]